MKLEDVLDKVFKEIELMTEEELNKELEKIKNSDLYKMFVELEKGRVFYMTTYNNLTIDQKIGLKEEFIKNPRLQQYYAIMKFWNFKIAIEYFLNDDIKILYKEY